jgi:hypothetical protein
MPFTKQIETRFISQYRPKAATDMSQTKVTHINWIRNCVNVAGFIITTRSEILKRISSGKSRMWVDLASIWERKMEKK